MQEKRNIRLVVSLVLLTIITTVAYWFQASESTTLKIDKNIFKVEDFKSISKVVLESPNGKVELKYIGSRWKVNEKYEADRNLIDVLFATLQQAEPKRPVAASLKDSLTNVVKNQGVKVSLISEDKPVKLFFVAGNAAKTQTYFLSQDLDELYIMTIPGYRVYISGVFELAENNWRDKRIFNFNWKNFKSLTASFSSQPKQNFKVSFIKQYFGIEGLAVVDTTKLNNYLDAVSLLNADQYIAKGFSKKYDSLSLVPPTVTIEVRDVADRTYQLLLYPLNKEDSNILGKLGDGESVLFQRQRVADLIKGKDYFVKH